jgi:hypothetical protein
VGPDHYTTCAQDGRLQEEHRLSSGAILNTRLQQAGLPQATVFGDAKNYTDPPYYSGNV